MVMLALRFDLRNPDFAGVSSSERINAALDMAAWADERGGVAVSISEHHCSDDGYLPSPLLFAAAAAARTKHVQIGIGALLVPFYDPIRLAEDIAVLDNISQGRAGVILGTGYVAAEFEMYGVDLAERGRRMEETVETLRKAWTGEPFEFRGRTARVTPTPHTPGGPPIVLGGSTNVAARRAARIADGYLPVSSDSWPAYRDEMLKLGKPDPGPRDPMPVITTVLARDPEKAWDELLPYFMHEMNAYGAWLEGAGASGPYKTASAEELRAGGQYRILSPEQLVAELKPMGEMAFAMFHPMVGGIPPAKAWESLELFEKEVVPALA